MRVKKLALLFLGCFILSIGSVFGLYYLSKIANHRKNGFIRLFPPSPLNPLQLKYLNYSNYYIAGIEPDQVFLGNYKGTNQLLKLSHILSDSVSAKYINNDTTKIAWNAVRSYVDSPYVYLMDGLLSKILIGQVNKNIVYQAPFYQVSFSACVPLSPTSYIIRTYSDSLKQNILRKIISNKLIAESKPILEKQIDGIFCTDGTLIYNRQSSRLLYTYFYRNKFICIDTNLNVLYEAKTIDTNTFAKIKVGIISSEHKFTLSAPPQQVNKSTFIYQDKIYIQSSLKANNEPESLFNQCSVIDVYLLDNGKYINSFYVPDYRNKKLQSFAITNGYLFALYDHWIFVNRFKS